MKRKNIWWIVGLMSAAVVGLTVIQVYWLNYSIDLNESKFDEGVRNTLTEVKRKIEAYDEQQHETYSNIFRKRKQESNLHITSDIYTSRIGLDSIDLSSVDSDIRKGISDYIRLTNKMDIAERINVEKLDKFLQNELESSSIGLDYDYGIYSEEQQDFVIANGHFLTPIDKEVKASTVQMPSAEMTSNLRNSPYSIKLFNVGYDAPGALVLHFPSRRSFIWKTVWPMLIPTVLFLSIILYAFIYSLNVIFRQKKLSEMKSDFINNMTHEFKTPIATISLATDSIMSDRVAGQKEKVGRFAKIIKQENRRMLGQVEKVLQMAQIEQNEMNLNWDSVNVHDLVHEAIENVELVVQSRGGTIVSDLQATKPIIMSDHNHLSNVIHNLLDNANKYSPEAPHIEVKTKNVSQGIEITVTDQGQGMTKEAKKHIFDKFYRVHTGNRHDVKGFGLGLSYVKAIIQEHNGAVRVKSEIGKGSSFTLFFPFENQ